MEELIQAGDIESVRRLLDFGHPADMPPLAGVPAPLMYAVFAGNPAIVALLLERGADPERPMSDGGDTAETMLTFAMVLPDPEPVVSALLHGGADPNRARPDGWTPLLLAVASGHTATVEALLAAGADIQAPGPSPQTIPVAVAEHHGHRELAAMLRARGATHPVDACEARLATIIAGIDEWLSDNAPELYESQVAERGAADPADVAELEAALGRPLPDDLRAYLRLFGATGGLDIAEYIGISVKGMLAIWRAADKGIKDSEIEEWTLYGKFDPESVQAEFWHPGWVPFAYTGKSDSLCLDLAPASGGDAGQIINWSSYHGPSGPYARNLESYLARYRDGLVAGKYVYNEGLARLEEA
jgi:cell wall assembly regulator SMI1